MGMFDTVVARCPKCSAKVDFQSKAGPCDLLTYSANSVPVTVAYSLHRAEETCTCGCRFALINPAPSNRVSMTVQQVFDEDEEVYD